MLRIGLTGGIGSGKSTVSKLLTEHGFLVIDADHIARVVVEPGQPALKDLADAFGADVLNHDGSLNRGLLAQRAFDDSEHTALLNSITHPRIELETKRLFKAAEDSGAAAVIWDNPLLVDKGYDQDVDLVIVVDVDADERVRRLTNYRNLSEEDARARIVAQIADDLRISAADVVIDNNGELEALKPQVDTIVAQLQTRLNARNAEA